MGPKRFLSQNFSLVLVKFKKLRFITKGVDRKISSGGQRKKDRKIAKKIEKNSITKPLPGGGGNEKNKSEKKNYLASIYYICTMYENPTECRSPWVFILPTPMFPAPLKFTLLHYYRRVC